MKIQIKDLGAIQEATIDLSKKLNVFCGQNGTGKTYAAFAIYALTNITSRSLGIRLDDEIKKKLLKEDVVELKLNVDEIWKFRKDELKKVNNNFGNLFAVAENKSKDFFKNAELNIDESQEFFTQKISNLKFDYDLKIFGYLFNIKKSTEHSITVSISNPESLIKDEKFVDFLEIVFFSRLYSVIAFYPITSSTIFPVERNSIYTFNKELSVSRNEALDHLQAVANKQDKNRENRLKLFFGRSSRYPRPIIDVLEVSEDLSNIQKKNSEYYEFAESIEKDLLNGKILITKEGEVEFASNKAKTIKLSFHQSSSIVKTLASLVIYLKHTATKNDLVIIDEPELNLHPENQILLARIFARLVNKGLRFVISTHSDYIIREFNNLIMIGEDGKDIKEVAKKYGYKEDEKISISDIGVYQFSYESKKSKKTVVQSVEIKKDGFDVGALDKTIKKLNDITDELFYTMKYGKLEE